MEINVDMTFDEFKNMEYPDLILNFGIPMLPISGVQIQGQPIIENEARYSHLDMIYSETVLSEDVFSYYYFNFLKWLCRRSEFQPNPLDH